MIVLYDCCNSEFLETQSVLIHWLDEHIKRAGSLLRPKPFDAQLTEKRTTMLDPQTTAPTNSTAQMIGEINGLLADHFALYVKTKNFHWHVKGPRFRDLHLLFDELAI